MKKITPFIIVTLLFINGFAQLPQLQWTKLIGGSLTEAHGSANVISKFYGRLASVDVDQNNLIYIATSSKSNDFYVSDNFGEEDVWLICMNMNGDTLWTKVFGGMSSERALRVRCFGGSNGGCILAGHSYSTDGAFNQNHETASDGYLIRIDPSGNVVWSKMYGGTNFDYLLDVFMAADGYLYACGEAHSDDGDLTGSTGNTNWLIKVNLANGNLIWSKTIQGPNFENADRIENMFRIAPSTDNALLITGYSSPNFLDFNLERISIFKVDYNGNLIWTKKVGAAGSGDYPAAIIPTTNGQFYILGHLQANIGGNDDASNYYGGNGDFWLVKFDSNGNKIWDKNFGGTDRDIPYDMKQDDAGNLYLIGLTASTDHDATTTAYGENDYWLLKVTAEGTILNSARFGGSANDFASGMAFTQSQTGFVIVGGTESTGGMVGQNFGERDIWILKFGSSVGISSSEFNSDIQIFPNPASESLNIRTTLKPASIQVYNAIGKCLISSSFKQNIDVSFLTVGYYFVTFTDYQGNIIDRKTIGIQ